MTQSWLLDVPAQQAYRAGSLVEPTVRRWDFYGFDISYNSSTGRMEIRSGSAQDWKESVRAATTVALPANTRTGNTLTANANGALPAIDGVTMLVGELLLVQDEALGQNNGLFQIDNLGGAGSQWSMTRHVLANENGEVTPGMTVYVEEGTVNGRVVFVCINQGTITLNSTALTFAVLATAAAVGVTLAVTNVNNGMSPYTVLAADYTLDCDTTTGVITIDLPAGVSVGRRVQVVDSGGDAFVSNITINAAGGETINGAASYVISSDRESVNLYKRTGTDWGAV